MKTLPVPVLLLAILFPAAARAEGPRTLREVDLGEQVSMSTGAFPYVNALVHEYEDRGVAVVGFQVRRPPDVAQNDVNWFVANLHPAFPVVRLASEWDWPQPYLPWVVVFDHRGERVYTGGLQTIEALLDDLTAKAPDWLVGGPVEQLADAAAAIAADRAHAGRHLPAIRERAKAGGPDAEEARALLGCVEAWFDRQVEKAETDVWSVVEGAEIYRGLAARFEGDALGDRANELLHAVVSDPAWPRQEEAWKRLAAARAAHFLLPPPGQYIYHPTEMHYRNSDDPALIARRARMLAEFRLALRRIERDFPDTDAAAIAGDLRLANPALALDDDQAAARIEHAAALLGGEPTDAGLAEAWLVLAEAAEGRPDGDATGAAARERLAAIESERGADLARALAGYADRNERVRTLIGELEAGGSALSREQADELACLRALDESFAGPAQLGVAFDGRYEGDGVRIGGVYPRTAAAVADLRAGDVVLGLDGKAVSGAEDFRDALAGHHPGDRVVLTVRRAGEEADLTVEVVLGRRVP